MEATSPAAGASALGSPEFAWKMILLLASSLWFCFVASIVSAKLSLDRALRARREDEVHRRSSIPPPEPTAGNEEQPSLPATAGEEYAAPDLHFRPSFRAPEVIEKNGGPASSTTARASRYSFVSERDWEGFLHAPKTATMFVQESFVHSDSELDAGGDGCSVTDAALDYGSGDFSERDLAGEDDDSSSWSSDKDTPAVSEDGEDDAAPPRCCPSPTSSSEPCVGGEGPRVDDEESQVAGVGEDDAESPPPDNGGSHVAGVREDDASAELQSAEGESPIAGDREDDAAEMSMEEMEAELDELWEQDDVIEMLKMEIKKARSAGALPTIAEDSSDCGLKPPKPSSPPAREDPIAALCQLHKGYRERMKKLDVLNYQKISAMGLLQLKDSSESIHGGKFWRRHRRCGDGSAERLQKEIQRDLETVYVGQTCLSWEFLHWQYQRTGELVDTGGGRGGYNVVAGELQQFQVLVERFLEDEPFQGPRVLNYNRNRRLLRGLLLQVPLLRADGRKKKTAGEKDAAISIDELEYMMENSIRVFWEFIRAEKIVSPTIVKSLLASPVQLQDTADQDLAVEVQALLKQKQKMLKEELWAGAWLVKSLKSGKSRSNQDDLFFAQVDLKLVARVLAMAAVSREQLSWCLRKLKKIKSVDRMLLREPSFLLFPC